eukprot:834741-Prymnesium_polylepis.1
MRGAGRGRPAVARSLRRWPRSAAPRAQPRRGWRRPAAIGLAAKEACGRRQEQAVRYKYMLVPYARDLARRGPVLRVGAARDLSVSGSRLGSIRSKSRNGGTG